MCLICPICPFIKEAKGIKQDITTWKLKRQKTVQSENIAYMKIQQKKTSNLKYIQRVKEVLKIEYQNI